VTQLVTAAAAARATPSPTDVVLNSMRMAKCAIPTVIRHCVSPVFVLEIGAAMLVVLPQVVRLAMQVAIVSAVAANICFPAVCAFPTTARARFAVEGINVH